MNSISRVFFIFALIFCSGRGYAAEPTQDVADRLARRLQTSFDKGKPADREAHASPGSGAIRKELERGYFTDPAYQIQKKHLGQFFNSVEKWTFIDGWRRGTVVVKKYSYASFFKWLTQEWLSTSWRMRLLPGQRIRNEMEMTEAFLKAGLNVPGTILVSEKRRVIVKKFIPGVSLDKYVDGFLKRGDEGLGQIALFGEALAKGHKANLTVGDTKPSNALILNQDVFFIDLDQARRGGDKAWDISQFLYYPLFTNVPNSNRAKLFAKTFLGSYVANGGKKEDIKKALGAEYIFPYLPVPTVTFANSHSILIIRKVLKELSQTI